MSQTAEEKATAKAIADAVATAVADTTKALEKTVADKVATAVAEALKGASSGKAPKAKPNQTMITRALNVSQSTMLVGFKPSEDHGKMIKGRIYPVSENVAEILELKELGSKCELPPKKKKVA